MHGGMEARFEAFRKATGSYIAVLRRDARAIHADLMERYGRDPFQSTELGFIPEAYREDEAAADFVRGFGYDKTAGLITASYLHSYVGILQETEDPLGIWFRVSRAVPERMVTHVLSARCADIKTLEKVSSIFEITSFNFDIREARGSFPPGREENAWQAYHSLEGMPGVSVRMETE